MKKAKKTPLLRDSDLNNIDRTFLFPTFYKGKGPKNCNLSYQKKPLDIYYW